MNKIEQVEELKNNPQLFNEKFNALDENYIFKSWEDTYEFIKQHPGLLIIIDEYTPYLNEHFPKGIIELEVDIDPEIITWKTLIINVKVDKETYENGCYEYLTYLRRKKIKSYGRNNGIVNGIKMINTIKNHLKIKTGFFSWLNTSAFSSL